MFLLPWSWLPECKQPLAGLPGSEWERPAFSGADGNLWFLSGFKASSLCCVGINLPLLLYHGVGAKGRRGADAGIEAFVQTNSEGGAHKTRAAKVALHTAREPFPCLGCSEDMALFPPKSERHWNSPNKDGSNSQPVPFACPWVRVLVLVLCLFVIQWREGPWLHH